MANQDQERRSIILMALLALWVAAWGYSLFFLAGTPLSGKEFTRGLTRIGGFYGWQGVAGILAFGCWGVGWSFPKSSGIRRISAVPLGLAVVLIVIVLGMALIGG